jgi:hypothetical protein
VAHAGQPDLLAVMESRRDLDVDCALLDDQAVAYTLVARVLDQLAEPAAPGTGLRADELAEGGA